MLKAYSGSGSEWNVSRALFTAKELEKVCSEYEAVLNAISEGVHWVGLDGLIRFENPAAAKMLGYEISELIGKHAHQVMHHHRADGSFFPVEECSVYATLRDGLTRHVEDEVFWRKDGTSFSVDYTTTAIHDKTGRPVGSVVTFVDTTERKKFEAALQNARDAAEASSRAKSIFLGNMSHEFRTPLNGVIGLSDQLLRTELDSDQRNCANLIRLSGESLLIVANNILDFSKIEAKNLELEVTEVDLRELIDQVMELFKAPAQSKNLNLQVIVAENIPNRVLGDPDRLRQILSNLVGNAVKFTPQGEVVLTVSRVSEAENNIVLRFVVQDTGIGITVEGQAQLFEAFSQADGSNTRKFGGSGLGLAISKRLVELMKGTISFESVHGKGSQFKFEIPFRRKSGRTDTVRHKDLHGLHLLVVGTSEAEREILIGHANAVGMRCVCASSSDEAMSLLRKSVVDDPFELAILGLQTPGADSLSLARTIGRDPLLSSLKSVMIAPQDDQPHELELKAANIAGLAFQPIQVDQLFDQLAAAMSSIVAKRERQIAMSGSLPKQYRDVVKRKEIKILLAEDNKINQMVFLSTLQKLGYGANLAINGAEALKAVDKDEYDLIFMDCQMPEMDGYEATRQIRAGRRHQPRIIAITANIMHGDVEECRGAGMDDYMSKPVRMDKLREMIDRWLPR